MVFFVFAQSCNDLLLLVAWFVDGFVSFCIAFNDFLFCSHGFPMVLLLLSYVLAMVFCCFNLVFQWCSYALALAGLPDGWPSASLRVGLLVFFVLETAGQMKLRKAVICETWCLHFGTSGSRWHLGVA